MLYTPLMFYIFISFSMPNSLIRAYLQEAYDMHAVVVLRGVDQDLSLKKFLINKLQPLLKDHFYSTDIRIDPLLFEHFNVKTVPTFVYTFRRTDGKKEKVHWAKLSGAVTAHWAARRIVKEEKKNDSADIASWISRGQKTISESSVEAIKKTLKSDKVIAQAQQEAAIQAMHTDHVAVSNELAEQGKIPNNYYRPVDLSQGSVDTKGFDAFSATATNNFSEVVSQLNVIDRMRNDISKESGVSVFSGNVAQCHRLNHIPLFRSCCAKSIEREFFQLNKCSVAEYALARARDQGRTHFVGSYCLKHARLLFGRLCIKEARVYCVFSSKLARIVQESARHQLETMFQEKSSEAQNTIISTVSWPYHSIADRWYRLHTGPVAVAVWSGAFSHPFANHHPDVFFAICQRGVQCGVLPQLTYDELEVSDGESISGWLIKREQIEVKEWQWAVDRIWLKGKCILPEDASKSDTVSCNWLIKQVGEAGYPDMLTDDVQWQLFSPQSGYSNRIITTNMGIQIQSFSYTNRDVPAKENSIHLKIKLPSQSWKEIMLPVLINKSEEKTIFISPKIMVWGGCQLSTGACHYWLTSRVTIKPLHWGTAKRPNCRGLTPQELLIINWHHIPLTS